MLNRSIWREFSFFEKRFQVLIYVRHNHAVELGDEFLREPNGIAFQTDPKLRRAVGIDQELPPGGGEVCIITHV